MRQQTLTINEADRAILLALSRYHYLTAAQVTRLLYPNLHDENRYSQRRLRNLAEAGYVLRIRDLPTPRYGSAPLVFTLARRGRQLLAAWGIEAHSYYRPSEEIKKARNNPFMEHTLAAIDVLVAADSLCREYPVACPRLLTERALKAARVYVDLPIADDQLGRTRRTAVIPDAWFQLSVIGRPPYSIALELDRATEEKKAWRRKVQALALWMEGPYRKSFEADNLTIAVVTPHELRRDALRTWTLHELEQQGTRELADYFMFTAASPVSSTPAEFFFGGVWHLPNEDQAVSLLPVPAQREVSVETA
jgi:hypothetical protein